MITSLSAKFAQEDIPEMSLLEPGLAQVCYFQESVPSTTLMSQSAIIASLCFILTKLDKLGLVCELETSVNRVRIPEWQDRGLLEM